MLPPFISRINNNTINIGIPLTKDVYIAISKSVDKEPQSIYLLSKGMDVKIITNKEGLDQEEVIYHNASNHDVAGYIAKICNFEYDSVKGAKSVVVLTSSRDNNDYNIIVLPVGNHLSISLSIINNKKAHASIENISTGEPMKIGSVYNSSIDVGLFDKTISDALHECLEAPNQKKQLNLFQLK